jgi:chemotaxis protein methyltransferase CheR
MGNVVHQASPRATPAMFGVDSESLSDENFVRLSDFIHSYCGIKITQKKKTMLDGRLRRRMRVLNIANINEYCRQLFDGNGRLAETEMAHFIDTVTTNKTDFFREPAHFRFMQEKILPALYEARRREIRIWSAASSTGAEAYTIAMVLDDFCSAMRGIDYSVIATDINTDVLNKGVAGFYPDIMLDPIPEDYRRRYILLPVNPSRREFRIAPPLRAKVAFSHLNLMDDHYDFDRNFDMIFCRNILIYFDRETQTSVLSKLCGHLRLGGYLFLGHSESINGISLPLRSAANTIFQRR